MSWKILITASGILQAGQRAQDLLRGADCELIVPPAFGPFKAGQLTPLLNGADAVLASLDEFTADVLSSPVAARLKIVARWGVGYDSVDLAAATRNGVVVTNTPGTLEEAVADYTMALLLSIARRVHDGHELVRRNEWKRLLGDDVGGKTLGLIGCGRIGQAVARRAAGFNLRLLAYAPRPRSEAEKLGVQFAPLETVLAESDFVSLHAALTPQNHGMIGEAQLRKMKPTAYLINTARGALVDEAALTKALTEGRLAGAALDVFVTEPLPAGHPLRSAPNLLLSPHQGSFARDTSERVGLSAAQSIVDLKSGRRPQPMLNPEVFESAVFRARR